MTESNIAAEPQDTNKDETLARLDPARTRLGEQQDKSLVLAQTAATLASDKKAENVAILSVASLTSYADYFVVSSAPSERQVNAISSSVEDTLRRGGEKPIGVEGKNDGGWVLIDFGDIVVHTFSNPAREYYDIEGFWSDAERIEIDETLGRAEIKRLEAIFAENQKQKIAG